MALETSPRPAPRPISTDLPYGLVDRVEDFAPEVLANGGATLAASLIGGFILVLILGIAIAWAQRGTPKSSTAYLPRRQRATKSRSIPPKFRPASPELRTFSQHRASPAPYGSKYPIRRLPVFPVSGRLSGKCYVIDGDTIVIQRVKIRLAGIDAPELDRPFGQKSKWEMVKICKGQVITARLTGERSHDRLVGTCHLPDGTDIGAELVKRGLALDWAMFSGGRYRQLEPRGVRSRLMWARHYA